MPNKIGLCHVCGKTAASACSMCGKAACSEHLKDGVCSSCRMGKR